MTVGTRLGPEVFDVENHQDQEINSLYSASHTMPHQELETSFVFQPVWNWIVYNDLANVVQFKENELYDERALFLLQSTYDQRLLLFLDL